MRFRNFARILGLSLLGLLSVAVLLYTQCFWFDLTPSSPFHGEILFNPYENVDLSRGFMSNFHAHSDCWGGMLNGYGTEQQVMDTYKNLGYDLYEVSNYHKLSHSSTSGLHTYEHGWGISKTHQLVIGGSQIEWLDFPFFQNVHQKQTILYKLRDKNPKGVIVLAHPSLREAYSAEDIASLDGAHCFEVINKLRKSKWLWDEVLTRGKYLPIVGSDDCHDIRKPRDIGRCGTFVFSQNPNPLLLGHALKSGRTIAVEFLEATNSDCNTKRTEVTKESPLHSISVRVDTIILESLVSFKSVMIIGDHSDTLRRYSDVKDLSFRLPGDYSYARFELVTTDGRVLYTNPIVRGGSEVLKSSQGAVVNPLKTAIYRFIIIFIVGFTWIFIFVRRNEKISRKLDGKSLGDLSYRRAVRSVANRRSLLPRTGK